MSSKPRTSKAPTPKNSDEAPHGHGGSYMIGEDGVRRLVESGAEKDEERGLRREPQQPAESGE